MIASLKVLILLSFCGLGFSFKYPRNADQTLWAFRTCERERGGPGKTEKWRNWDLPNNSDTHCYVKCIWQYLGMWNFQFNSIYVDAIATQYMARGRKYPKELANLALPTDGTCKTVYDKSIDFINKEKKNLDFVFFHTEDEYTNWIKTHADLKPIGKKISEFCKGKEGGSEGKCKHACSMYHYRLVDEQNNILPLRELRIYGKHDSEFIHCKRRAANETGCRVGDVLYHCIDKIDKKGFAEVLKRWDDESITY
uniref:Conserved secreted protein n=1 Tax=Phlebotomus kandelakii TaxID=1109342 RepID=A0A6B2ENM4_9DIPT